MWRNKKVIVGVVLAAVLLFGSLGGVAFANTENGDDSPEARQAALLERVCEIYQEKTGVTIDHEALKDSFVQARSEMQQAALENRLAQLVEEGQITQGEADQYLEWWESKPDVPVRFGFRGMGGMRGFCGPFASAE